MPNWCTTDYVAFGEKADIEKLKKKLDDAFNIACRIENNFGNWWLGNVLDLHGLDWQKYDCRGDITQVSEVEHNFYEEGKSHFMFQTWTAWTPCYRAFEKINNLYPNVELYYFAEEDGCGLFETNDVSGIFHPERIRLRTTDLSGNTEDEYFANEKELLIALNKKEKCLYGTYSTWWEFVDEMDCAYSGDSPYDLDWVKVIGGE